MAPFGSECEFGTLEACIAANQDKNDPGAYCAVLMRDTEEHCAGRFMKEVLRSGGIVAQGQHYEIKLTTEAIGGEEGGQSFLGQTQEATNVIVIDGTMPKTRQEEVLLHELIHIADMTVPEFAVNSIGRHLYGILRGNGLLPGDIIEALKPGVVTPEEMAALHRHNEELEQQMVGMLRISEKPWDTALASDGQLLYHDATSGEINRAAVHQAAAAVVKGSIKIDRRRAARELLQAYRDMGESAPTALIRLAL